MADAQTILILGAGFGGIAAANTLRRLLPDSHEIVVVDQSARFYVGAGKTWIMLGERTFEQISQARSALLEPGISFRQTAARKLDLATRVVETDAGPLRWDRLVIALGADVTPEGVPGLATAHTFYTVAGAERLQPVLAEFRAGEIVILIPKTPFKCPPAPYEAAMLVRQHFISRGLGEAVRVAVYTVEGSPMATAGPDMGAYIRGELKRQGIGFFPQKKVKAVSDGAKLVAFEDGSSVHCDLLISVLPHVVPAVIREAGLAGPSGWVPVDPRTMEVAAAAGTGRVFAVGDVTSVPLPGRFKPDLGLVLPKAGVMAEAQGEVAAHQIAARILGSATDRVFDGHGACYFETGAGLAVKGEADFFALPHPAMEKREPSAGQMQDKLQWVERHLRPKR